MTGGSFHHHQPRRHRRHGVHADRQLAGGRHPGLSRGADGAGVADGEFVPRLMLPLSLSYDHRVIDGADAARFRDVSPRCWRTRG